jgi:hypothetical protein
MPGVSDVDLMQLADGTLGPADRKRVEGELAQDPDLRERLDAFLATGKVLAHLFEPVVRAPVPDRLVDVILRPDNLPPRTLHRQGPTRRGGLRDLFARRLPSLDWALSPATLAAAIVCAIALGASIFWAVRPDSLVGVAPEVVARALEGTPSGERSAFTLVLRGAASLEPSFSFQHRDGRYCRQYELALGGGRGFVGFACRSATGDWQIERDAVAAVRHDEGSKTTIKPAGTSAAQDIEDAVDRVMVGDPLESERELRLMRGGWRADR